MSAYLIFAWTGAIVLFALSLAVVAFAVALVIECGRKLLDRWRWDVIEVRNREIGNQIANSAYWYSESLEALALMQALGEALTHGRSVYPGDGLRDDWYRRTAVLKDKKEREARGRTS